MNNTDLLSFFAHELKNPLSIIKLNNQKTLIKDRSKEQYKLVLHENIQEIEKLENIIKSIYELFADICATQKEINMINILSQSIKDAQKLADKKQILIKTQCDIKEFLSNNHPNLAYIIMQNLLQNAIKFSSQNATISISIITLDNNIQITIEDEGMGVSEDLDIFEAFVSSDNSKGLGLGLFICKMACKKLEAKLTLKNSPKGTIATLSIPKK